MSLNSEYVNMAIEIEEEGYNYYSKYAQETNNKLSRTVLESLAEQELEHKKRFKEIAEGKNIVANEIVNIGIEEKVKNIFNVASKAEKEEWKDEDVEVYKQAL